ncbi:MAG TPA: universal stress protein [Candidatus Hydrogenedentes bacterium]|nr:universal stress protein [Candidatus Hydrogenedentota bacterium]
MFQHLLIPLDGSAMAEAVAPSAGRLAEMTGARVTLLHVIEAHTSGEIHGGHHLTMHEEAEGYLQEMGAKYFRGVSAVSWHVHAREVRDVAHSVSDHADEFDPDLIIMCAHGREGWWQWYKGTLAHQVVKQSTAPVLLFRWMDALSPEFPFKRVLIPLDGDPMHEGGVEAGIELARLSKASADLLEVVPTCSTLSRMQGLTKKYMPGATRAVLNIAEDQARDYLGEKLQHVHEHGIRGTASVVRGEPFREISRYIRQTCPDLVVLGTHGKIGTEAFWAGSLTQRFLETCNSTFLLAPAV